MTDERRRLPEASTDHPAPAADANKPPSDAALEEFVEKAKASPETIDWDTVTKAQRDAIVRSYGIEPIDWEGMSDEELRAAREASVLENLIHEPRRLYKTGDLSGMRNSMLLMRNSMLLMGLHDDWANSLFAYPSDSHSTDDQRALLRSLKELPLNNASGAETYSHRFSRKRDTLALALTNPAIQKLLDKLTMEAYDAAQRDDVDTLMDRASQLRSIDNEASKQREAIIDKVEKEWIKKHINTTGVSPTYFQTSELVFGDPTMWQDDKRFLERFIDVGKKYGLPTYTQQVGEKNPEIYAQSDPDKVALIDALIIKINTAIKQDDLETIKTNLVQLFALRDQPLGS